MLTTRTMDMGNRYIGAKVSYGTINNTLPISSLATFINLLLYNFFNVLLRVTLHPKRESDRSEGEFCK